MPLLLYAQPPSKPKIARDADIPQFQYAISGKVEDLMKSEEAFRPLGAQIRKNIESVLRDYDIPDAATHRGLLRTLAALDLLENRDAEARKKLDRIRLLEEKPAAKLMGNGVELTMRAVIDARSQTSDRNSAAYRQAVHDSLKHALDPLPYEVVQNDLKSTKSGLEGTSEITTIARLRSVYDPMVARSGSLSSNLAHGLPLTCWMLIQGLPMKATVLEAFGSYLAAHTKEKMDIWAARNVDLAPGKNYALVKVAVWDAGVDLTIFKDQVAKDSSGRPAVIAFDIESRRTTGALLPLTPEQASRYPEVVRHLKGQADVSENLDTPEAAELRRIISALKPGEVGPFQDELSLFQRYAHGTHVAGILMWGNPYARLAVGRSTGDHRMIPQFCPSAEYFDRAARANREYVDFFNAQGVRVVNMSWGGSVSSTEARLEQCGIGKPGNDRTQIARQWFGIWKKSLEDAFRSAPEILFVTTAGNGNIDPSLVDGAPGGMRMPNLVTVGAVDTAGDETAFTGYGPSVAVQANGYAVESYIPGGGRLKMSGTSMAAPNVGNLAAKILAVNPKLTPPEVIALIRQTAEKSDNGRLNLIHPKNAVAAARNPN